MKTRSAPFARIRRYTALLYLTTIVLGVLPASAADWRPTRPIELISGVAAGGSLDIAARAAQRIFQEKRELGQPINVINKPGGGNAIAWTYLNTHAGNAHYLSLTTNSLVINPILGTSTIGPGEVTPIVHLSREDIVFNVRADFGVKTAQELVERLKKAPASLSFGIATSLGNPSHIAIAQVARASGVDLRSLKVVVFNASTQAMATLLGGNIDVLVSSPGNPAPHVQAGKLRALAVSSTTRLGGAYATTPTWREVGVPSVSRFWRGVIGPKGLTPAQIAFWEAEFGALVATDEWKKYLADNFLVADFMSSRDAAAFLKSEAGEYRALLTELGLAK